MLHHIENHIENMRQKPDHVKHRYAFLVSLSVTLVIFGGWVVGKGTSSHAVAKKPMAPVKALTATAGDAFEYARSFFGGSNKAEYKDTIEVLPGRN